MRAMIILVGVIVGFIVGELAAEILFTAIFEIKLREAEGTKYELYSIFMTFNGAIFGSAIGGVFGFVLSRKCRS